MVILKKIRSNKTDITNKIYSIKNIFFLIILHYKLLQGQTRRRDWLLLLSFYLTNVLLIYNKDKNIFTNSPQKNLNATDKSPCFLEPFPHD